VGGRSVAACSLAEASERGVFRAALYSLQGDHAHLIVEAQGKHEGFHHRTLRSPREVRRALAYVLLAARRHLARSGAA
jgi:hypothetical protein